MIATLKHSYSIEVLGPFGKVKLGQVADLLAEIDRHPTMKHAASVCGLSYRSAWSKLAQAEESIGRSLLHRHKGHGCSLSNDGRELLAAVRALRADQAKKLAAPQASFADFWQGFALQKPRWRLAASHDVVLDRVCAEAFASSVELSNVGSEAAIASLLTGRADAAGFHYADTDSQSKNLKTLLARRPAFHVQALFCREIGLLVAAGNPLRLRGLADLTQPGIRYINRQLGAGTRAYFDAWLHRQGIAAPAIHGYGRQETTHHAVAAAIAAGAADAGLAIRASADAFKLKFLPLCWETYYLAFTQPPAHWAGIEAALRETSKQLPGYRRP